MRRVLVTSFVAALIAALAAPAAASENGLLYVCDTTRLSSENLCYFVASSTNTVGASGHNIDRSVAADGFRVIQGSSGSTLTLSPRPWTQGDVLAATTTEQTGDALNYVKAFEMMAPLRDLMMYSPNTLKDSSAEWAKWTKAFVDCSIKTSTTTETHGTRTLTVYGTDDIYALLKNPNNVDIHHSVLQYLEEGAIDLVCVMTSLSMDRCTTMRTTLNIADGQTSTCWQSAYDAIYSSSASSTTTVAAPPGTSTTTTTAPAAQPVSPSATSAAAPAPIFASMAASIVLLFAVMH